MATLALPGARSGMVRGLRTALLFALGGAALVVVVSDVGLEASAAALGHAVPLVPALLLLQALRIVAEAVATRRLLGRPLARSVPLGLFVRAHLFAHAASIALPAGRAAAEATKAAHLAKVVGGPRAAALATSGQSLALVANGAVAVASALAAWSVGSPSPLVVGLGLFALFSCGLGALVALVVRRPSLTSALRRFPRLERSLRAFHEAARSQPFLPLGPALAHTVARALHVAELGVALTAVGLVTGIAPSLVAHGVESIGTALCDFVPGQLGATEGAFRLASSAIGPDAALAVAVPALLHVAGALGAACALVGGVAHAGQPIAARDRYAVSCSDAGSVTSSAVSTGRRRPSSTS